MDCATLLGSSVLAALVAALVSLQNNERKLSLQYITGERAKWRDKIREIALAIFDASIKQDKETIRRCHFEFSHLLHLGDPPDDEILSNLVRLAEYPDDAEALNDFQIRISLLLKYEWDKAKLEAKWFEIETANRTSLEAFKQSATKANAAAARSSRG